MEAWKDVKGYEGYYQVSNLGNVRSVPRKILRPCDKPHRTGDTFSNGITLKPYDTPATCGIYKRVNLSRDGHHKKHFVHRLVAEAFIDNPNGFSIVNHIDNNPSNNRVENLEWTTQSGNILHAQRQGRMKSIENLEFAHRANMKPVIRIGEDGEEMMFKSATEAANKMHLHSLARNRICSCCRGENKTAYGYRWKFA